MICTEYYLVQNSVRMLFLDLKNMQLKAQNVCHAHCVRNDVMQVFLIKILIAAYHLQITGNYQQLTNVIYEWPLNVDNLQCKNDQDTFVLNSRKYIFIYFGFLFLFSITITLKQTLLLLGGEGHL